MIILLILLLDFGFTSAEVYYGQLGDPFDDSKLMIHAYLGRDLVLTTDKDGAQMFRIYAPGLGGASEKKGISFESIKYPGYFITWTDDNKILLKKPGSDSDSKIKATFRSHLKVRTKQMIFSLEGEEYKFLCNAKDPPYPMSAKVDDNSRFFADRCSYGIMKLTEDQANKKLKMQTGKNIEETKKGPSAPENGTAPGKYVRLFITGIAGIRPILGIKADLFQRVRVAISPDQFRVKSPGLNGIEGTVSFESVKYPMFFLARRKRDIYLEPMKRNIEYYNSATFMMKMQINMKKHYFIYPYNQPEWYLGHLHHPPFYVRAMLNNNTGEFDLDTTWIVKYDKKVEIVGLGSHHDFFQALMKLLSLVHGPLSTAQEVAIFKALHGNDDLTELGNSTAIMELLQSQHTSLMLQPAIINGLAGSASVAGSSAMSDATSSSTSGANAGTPPPAPTGGQSSASSTAVTDDAGKSTEPAIEVVTEKYEPWSDWSSCSAQCGTGHQIRVRPCKVAVQSACVPLQQSQPCVASAPCQPAQIVNQPQTSMAVPVQQATQTASVNQACSSSCLTDCNPKTCPLTCCSSYVKKNKISRLQKPKKKGKRRHKD